MRVVLRYIVTAIVMLAAWAVPVFSQFSVTKTDVDAMLVNAARISYGWESFGADFATADLGVSGSTTLHLDLSAITMTGFVFADTSQENFVSPAGQHFADRFPSATVCAKSVSVLTAGAVTYTTTNITYFETRVNGLFALGSVNRMQVDPPQDGVPADTTQVDDRKPGQMILPLPLQMNATPVMVDTQHNTPTETEIRSHTIACNGFGSVKYPDGITRSSLRYIDDLVIVVTMEGGQIIRARQKTVVFLTQDGTELRFNVDTNYTSGATGISRMRFSKRTGSTAVAASESGMPSAFRLEQNYPNPFNPVTTIRYHLAQESRVNIAVVNILGETVRLLVDAVEPAGEKAVQFDAAGLPSGPYFYRIDAVPSGSFGRGFSQTRAMLLLK